jgi:hypothetical protein
MTTGKRVLSVDWDYFFPVKTTDKDEWMLYDWGAREAPFFIDQIWATREAAFLRAGKPLPMTSGEEKGFWKRFKFSSDAKLFISESHVHMCHADVWEEIGFGANILNFDAHHDAGYKDADMTTPFTKDGAIHCGNWVIPHSLLGGNKTSLVYPNWKKDAFKQEPKPTLTLKRKFDDGKDYSKPFDVVFVCRSGAWVPPWVDDDFRKFVAACPVKTRTELFMVERKHDPEAARKYADMLSKSAEQV